MASCIVCGKGGAKVLCMGCGKMACAACIFEVRGVKYCNNCKGVAQEFQKSTTNPTYVPDDGESEPRRKLPIYDTTPESKWEKHFDSSAMIQVESSVLKDVKDRIDLSAAYTPAGKRVISHLMDIAICMIFGFIVALAVLPNLAGNPLTLAIEGMTLDPLERMVLSIVIVGLIFLFLERVLLNSFGGITLGRLFTGTKLVAVSGLPAGVVRGTVHSVFSTLFDLIILGVIPFITAANNKRGQALHDTIAGTCVVDSRLWKKACTAAILQRDKERAGVPTPKRAAPAPSPGMAGAAGVAAAGASLNPPPKPLDLPPEDEILSPFATYDEYEPPEEAQREIDQEGEEGTDRYRDRYDDDKSDDTDDDEHSTDIRDPYNY